jgi:hypothetical protein
MPRDLIDRAVAAMVEADSLAGADRTARLLECQMLAAAQLGYFVSLDPRLGWPNPSRADPAI